ncbi:hypothetical protein JYU34_010252 [Plutella xylostella]|uniref:FP protein C-terminal domain-containing protein n=1 Tax=Plutella xylostella TaxID=51655 RepID=A0ABQ7QJA0_PLUXY|nr:hypothetical protein JYU34_010252 [Plutella xylostella]
MIRSPNKYQSNPDLSINPEPIVNANQRNKRKLPESEMMDAFQTLSSELKVSLSEWRSDMNTKISSISDSISYMRLDLDSLAATSKEIKTELNIVRADQVATNQRVNQLEDKQQTMSNVITDLQASIEFNAAEHTDLKNKIGPIKSMESVLETMQHKISGLESELNISQQRERALNVEILGLTETSSENLQNLLIKIGNHIGVQLSPSDIEYISRVQPRTKVPGRPKTVVAKLKSASIKDLLISNARKNRGFTTDDIGMPGKASVIFINEQLTPHNKELHKKIRDAAKNKLYRYVWIRNGKIFVRRDDKSPKILILEEKDIIKMV